MKTRFTVGARVRRCPLMWSDAEFGREVNCGEITGLLGQHGHQQDALVRFDDGREATYAVGTLVLLPADEQATEERLYKREVAELPGWARLLRRRTPREEA